MQVTQFAVKWTDHKAQPCLVNIINRQALKSAGSTYVLRCLTVSEKDPQTVLQNALYDFE